jgi:hypothetical protein
MEENNNPSVAELKVELLDVMNQLRSLYQTRGRNGASATQRAESITELNNRKSLLQEMLNQLQSGSSSASADQEAVNKMLKKISSIKDAPKFDGTGQADTFFLSFKHFVELYAMSGVEINLFLRKCIDPECYDWLIRYFPERESPITLTQVKDALYAQFQQSNWRTFRLYELLFLVFGYEDTPKRFVARFLHALGKLERNATSVAPEDLFLKELLYEKLPPCIKRHVKHYAEYAHVQALARDIETYPSEDVLPKAEVRACVDPFIKGDPKLSSSISTGTKRSIVVVKDDETPNAKRPKPIHERLGKTSQARDNTSSSGFKANQVMSFGEARSKKLCAYCGDPWSHDHKGQCMKWPKAEWKKGSEQLNMIITQAPGVEGHSDEEDTNPDNLNMILTQDPLLEGYSDLDEDTLFMTKAVTGNPDRLPHAPILINGVRVMGGIDTHATSSILTIGCLDGLRASLMPHKGSFILADGSKVSKLGKTNLLEVKCGDKTILWRFDVMELSPGTSCILGLDLLYQLGIGITGIPKAFPQVSSQAEPEIVERKADEICLPVDTSDPMIELAQVASWEVLDTLRLNKIESVNFAYFLSVYNESLESYLKPLFEENSKITGLCNHPLAVVKLETGPTQTVITRQYRVNRDKWDIMDKQVHKWLKEGVIRPVEEHSSWNHPLITVPKKDEQGNQSGWRVCIDPRPLNKLFPDIKYPLPLIREILEALGTSLVFSKVDLTSSFHQFRLRLVDQIKTTFTWHGTQYCFVGAPFGLKHVTAIFQKTMHEIFKDLSYVKVYENIVFGRRNKNRKVQ